MRTTTEVGLVVLNSVAGMAVAGVTLTLGCRFWPVPSSASVVSVFSADEATSSVALRCPVALGVKLNTRLQVWPCASVLGSTVQSPLVV